MAEIARQIKRYPSDLTDQEWSLIEPLIPPAKRGGNRDGVHDVAQRAETNDQDPGQGSRKSQFTSRQSSDVRRR